MLLRLKFAFRNVLRNKRRTLLSALSIFFASVIVVIAIGWFSGIMEMMFQNYTKYQTGDLRVVSEYYPSREKFMPVDEIIQDSDPLISELKSLKGVKKVEERARFGIMLASGDRTVHAIGMGIDFKTSEFDIRSSLVDDSGNRFTDPQLKEEGLYIGQQLAEKLKVKPGDVLLLAARTSEGGINGIKLKINGMFRMGMYAYDSKFFFITLTDAKRLLKLGEATTEVFIYKDKKINEKNILEAVRKILPSGIIVQTPAEQIGAYYSALEMSQTVYKVFLLFILFLASFVVINTMIMSIFERIKEIGTLKAIGMTDKEWFVNFTLEGAIIGGMGGITGTIIGALLVIIMYYTGVDMADAVKGLDMPIESIIRPKIGIGGFLFSLIASVLVPTLAAMIPSRYVKQFTPAEALRKV